MGITPGYRIQLDVSNSAKTYDVESFRAHDVLLVSSSRERNRTRDSGLSNIDVEYDKAL